MESSKHTEITDLGEGDDGRFARRLSACALLRAACLWMRRVPLGPRRLHHLHECRARCVQCRGFAGRFCAIWGSNRRWIPGEVEAPDVLAWQTTLLASASSSPIRAVAPRSSRRASMRLERGVFALEERALWISVAAA